MAARCRKFVPNLFNKTKCQSCFGAKEAHTAEALESSKAARKISKCAYLFVSPDLDFSNPLHRTKRWQRRFFILYDDGELTYSVDDNPSTIPQGSVDMNKCTDVFDAEDKTGHEYSIGVAVPNEPTSYVKGTSKDEIRRWFDVLVMYPRSLTIKTKRSPGKSGGGGVSRHLSYYPAGTEKSMSDDEDADSVHSKDSGDTYERSSRTRGRYKQRDLRRSKSEVRPSDLKLAEDEYNKKVPGGDGKLALSLAPSSDNQTKFSKEKNIDGLPTRRAGEPETFSSVRSMKHRKAAKNYAVHQQSAEAVKTPSSLGSTPSTAALAPTATQAGSASAPPLNRRSSIPTILTSSKSPEHKSLSRTSSATVGASGGGGALSAFVYPPSTPSAVTVLLDANETDEHKIAKNEHARKSMEKSPIVRKGWLLVRQGTSNVWSKHWFVLCGTSLSYYKDAKAEDTNLLDGVIDVGSAYQVTAMKAERNHGFKIQTKEGEYVLSAMTSGIRRNWIEAVESIIAEIRRAREKSARQDMGFVFESPVRSPRTPNDSNVTATPPPAQSLTPVVPDSSSRVNNALREMAERRRETGDDRPLEELYEVVPPLTRKDSACSDTEREVSVLTSKNEVDGASGISTPKVSSDVLQPPKSPSAFVSPSQKIKEKSRSKTPPRTRSPPPPALLPPASTRHGTSSKSSTPVDRMLLLQTGSSSDENDESLTAKLLESQKQVQHLQQQVQDVNSMVRKQRVEIESLQTKLDLTTSQLHDMETALTHSAQNLNKERKNVNRLNEALEELKRGHSHASDYQEKCTHLERQLQDATHKIASQEVKIGMVSSLEDQLQIRTSKLATLEKVLGNTRRHLQDAVENVRETELQFQTKLEELEQDQEEERVEMQNKLHQMEERLTKLVTESNNSINVDLSGQLLKEKTQAMRRLEELVKEQKGKIDQLTEDNSTARQQIDDLQCYKDGVAVNQNQLEKAQLERSALQLSVQSLENTLKSVNVELEMKDRELIMKCQENDSLLATIDELQDKCRLVQDNQMINNDMAQNYESEREMLREELESVTLELNNALETSRIEIDTLRQSHSEITRELQDSNAKVQSLKGKCKSLEQEIKKEQSRTVGTSSPTPAMQQQVASASTEGGYTLNQVVNLIGAVARSCERMTESAVAMLAGEMIETDIKAIINFNQEQRTLLGNKTVEQLLKKFAGVRQRLNYIVKNSVTKKLFDELQVEKDMLAHQLSEVESIGGNAVAAQTNNSLPAQSTPSDGNSYDFLTALLEQCRAEILCITTDITRLDISHIETKLQRLNTSLQQLDQQKSVKNFSPELSLASYCNKLSIQAAATFEMARTISSGVDISHVVNSVENCLKSTSGIVTSIEDLSLRSYALLVSERLLISYELDNLILTGQWKGLSDAQQTEDFTTKSLVAETLQRIDVFSLSQGKPLGEACLNTCLSNLLKRNITDRPSLEMLKSETNLIARLLKNVDVLLTGCVKSYCSLYTTELVNFGTVEIGEVEMILTSITSFLCKKIKQLISRGKLSELSTGWLHEQLCVTCDRVKGLDPKDMPHDLVEIALRLCMFESKLNMSSSLVTNRETSTLSQSLVSEASKLAGLSSELAKKVSAPGSVEARIAALAQRLEQTDRSLTAYASHYGDTVQQVMREVVHSLQMNVLRHQLCSGDHPATAIEQNLTQHVQQLQLQLTTANQRKSKIVNSDQHEEAVEALYKEMSELRVEHSSELDESKRDMKMVLKSVKAAEFRLATDLTEQISELKNKLSEEKRAHQVELSKLQKLHPEFVPAEEHIQLKERVRDLENCLHEMQEEFEEELYEERRAHLAEHDKTRTELLEVISKAEFQQLTTNDIQEQYETVIEKLKAEQVSLNQWIDDIRDAHHDEIDALQHERDAALADEVASSRAALDGMQSVHMLAVEQERSKLKDLQERTGRLVQVDRDLLLQTRENESKEKRIAALEGKVMTSVKKLAKLELNASKSDDMISKLKSLNEDLVERNSQLVERFSLELSKIGSTNKSSSDGEHMALKAKIEGLSEQLKLEQLAKRQLEEKMENIHSHYEQQLKQKEEEVSLEAAPASSSPPEDMLLKQRQRAASPSTSTRRSSPSVFASNSSPKYSGNSSAGVEGPLDSRSTVSPRRLADRSYDLSRSKSTPTMVKQPSPLAVGKRLSSSEEPSNSRPVPILDTNDRGFIQYQKSGGRSLADRMRKFT